MLQAELGVTRDESIKTKAQRMAADEGVKPTGKKGSNQHNGGCAIGTSSRGSNNAETIVRRLKRDAPEVAEKLAKGEYKSARAAGIAAGLGTGI